MDAFVALYLFMLAGITGYVLIASVPSILHTPLLSGSNFIHGVVLAGAMVALGHAEGVLLVTDRMLAMFESSAKRNQRRLEQENKLLAERDNPDQKNTQAGLQQDSISDNASDSTSDNRSQTE